MWETAWGKGFLDHFHQPTTLGTRELGDLACSCVFYQEGGDRYPLLSGFPNISDGLSKAQGSF